LRGKNIKKLFQTILKLNHEGFRKNFLEIFKRKTIQYFETNVQEQPIPGHVATAQVESLLVTLDQVRRKIQTIPEKDPHNIDSIHFGAVDIHIKASFQKGLDTPITITPMHNRMANRVAALIGIH